MRLKYAEGLSAPPSDGSGGIGSGSYSAGIATKSSEVQKMQQQMQSLADTVNADESSTGMAKRPGDTIRESESGDTLVSKTAFNDFIAEQYVGTLPEEKRGVEWSSSPTVTSKPAKKETETGIYESKKIMDTFKRTGAGSSEFKADGNWDFRTNNALKNTIGFAHAMLQLKGDFGFQTKFSNTELSTFESNVYKDDDALKVATLADKKTRANIINPILVGIKKMYLDFRQAVTANSSYRQIIENKHSKGLGVYTAAGSSSKLSAEEEKLSSTDTKVNVKYMSPKYKYLDYIPMSALKSKEAYLKWMDDAGADEALAIKIFNNVIKPNILNMTTMPKDSVRSTFTDPALRDRK